MIIVDGIIDQFKDINISIDLDNINGNLKLIVDNWGEIPSWRMMLIRDQINNIIKKSKLNIEVVYK